MNLSYENAKTLLRKSNDNIVISYILLQELLLYHSEKTEEILEIIISDYYQIISYEDKCLALLLKDKVDEIINLYNNHQSGKSIIIELLIKIFNISYDEKILDFIIEKLINDSFEDIERIKIYKYLFNREILLFYSNKFDIDKLFDKFIKKEELFFDYLMLIKNIISMDKGEKLITNYIKKFKADDLFFNIIISMLFNIKYLAYKQNYKLEDFRKSTFSENSKELFINYSKIAENSPNLSEKEFQKNKSKYISELSEIIINLNNSIKEEIKTAKIDYYYDWYNTFFIATIPFEYNNFREKFTNIIKDSKYYNNILIVLSKYYLEIFNTIEQLKKDEKNILFSGLEDEKKSVIGFITENYFVNPDSIFPNYWYYYIKKHYDKSKLKHEVIDYIKSLNLNEFDDIVKYMFALINFGKFFKIKFDIDIINLMTEKQINILYNTSNKFIESDVMEYFLNYYIFYNLKNNISLFLTYLIKNNVNFNYSDYLMYLNLDDIKDFLIEKYEQVLSHNSELLITFTLLTKDSDLINKLTDISAKNDSIAYKNLLYYSKLFSGQIDFKQDLDYTKLLFDRYYFQTKHKEKIEIFLSCEKCKNRYIDFIDNVKVELNTYILSGQPMKCKFCGTIGSIVIEINTFLNIYLINMLNMTINKIYYSDEQEKLVNKLVDFYPPVVFPFIGKVNDELEFSKKSYSISADHLKNTVLSIYLFIVKERYYALNMITGKFLKNYNFIEAFYGNAHYYYLNSKFNEYTKVMKMFYDKFMSGDISFYGKESNVSNRILTNFSELFSMYINRNKIKPPKKKCYCFSGKYFKDCCYKSNKK